MNNTNYKTRFCDHCGMPLALHNRECEGTIAAGLIPTYTFGDGHVYYRKSDIEASERATTASAAPTTVQMPDADVFYDAGRNEYGYMESGCAYSEAQMQAYGDARAEEARREARGYQRKVDEKIIERLRAQFAAQRTAGGDAELRNQVAYIAAYDPDELMGAKADQIQGRLRSIILRARKALAAQPAAEAAAQPTPLDQMKADVADVAQGIAQVKEMLGIEAQPTLPDEAEDAAYYPPPGYVLVGPDVVRCAKEEGEAEKIFNHRKLMDWLQSAGILMGRDARALAAKQAGKNTNT